MSDHATDERLQGIASRAPSVDPAVLARIAHSVEGQVTAVEPAPPASWLIAQLLAVFVTVAVASAAWAGFEGVAGLSGWQRISLLVTLAALALGLARECVARFIPGSPVRFSANALIAGTCAVVVALFTLLFRDYHTRQFVTAGLGCLEQGLLHAIPAALLGALVLRRGFATNPRAAALAGGALAGLTGVAFLELHCTNFEAPHQIVWHTAVILASAVIGALISWVVTRPARAHS